MRNLERLCYKDAQPGKVMLHRRTAQPGRVMLHSAGEHAQPGKVMLHSVRTNMHNLERLCYKDAQLGKVMLHSVRGEYAQLGHVMLHSGTNYTILDRLWDIMWQLRLC